MASCLYDVKVQVHVMFDNLGYCIKLVKEQRAKELSLTGGQSKKQQCWCLFLLADCISLNPYSTYIWVFPPLFSHFNSNLKFLGLGFIVRNVAIVYFSLVKPRTSSNGCRFFLPVNGTTKTCPYVHIITTSICADNIPAASALTWENFRHLFLKLTGPFCCQELL